MSRATFDFMETLKINLEPLSKLWAHQNGVYAIVDMLSIVELLVYMGTYADP